MEGKWSGRREKVFHSRRYQQNHKTTRKTAFTLTWACSVCDVYQWNVNLNIKFMQIKLNENASGNFFRWQIFMSSEDSLFTTVQGEVRKVAIVTI